MENLHAQTFFSVILKSKRGHSASPRNRLQNCLALHKIDKIKGYLRTVCACRYPSCSAFTWTQFYSPAPKYKIIQFKLLFWKIGLYVEKQVYLIKKNCVNVFGALKTLVWLYFKNIFCCSYVLKIIPIIKVIHSQSCNTNYNHFNVCLTVMTLQLVQLLFPTLFGKGVVFTHFPILWVFLSPLNFITMLLSRFYPFDIFCSKPTTPWLEVDTFSKRFSSSLSTRLTLIN